MQIKTKNRIRSVCVSIARFVFLLGVAYIILYPLLYMLSMAFRPTSQVDDPTVVWIPRSLTLDVIKETFTMMKYLPALKNTALLSIVSSLISVIVCAFVGYGFARFEFPLKNILFFGVVLTILVPVQTILIPMVTTMRYFDFFYIGQLGRLFGGEPWTVNLMNTPFAMYVPATFASGVRAGLFIFIYRQFFLGAPRELEDAAYIDGCGPVKTMLKVMLPLARGAIVIVLLFSVVSYWNEEFYTTFFYNNLSTLRTALLGVEGRATELYRNGNIAVAFKQAGALLYMAPPLIFFIIFQRLFTESIERTGIVG